MNSYMIVVLVLAVISGGVSFLGYSKFKENEKIVLEMKKEDNIDKKDELNKQIAKSVMFKKLQILGLTIAICLPITMVISLLVGV